MIEVKVIFLFFLFFKSKSSRGSKIILAFTVFSRVFDEIVFVCV